jgi:inorganic pyrophosphatase
VHAIDQIPPFAADSDGEVHVVIDTAKGSRNKVKWDPRLGVFKLSHVLSPGAVFPCDFGFGPGKRAPDGDAVDVLVLTDAPLFTGCLLVARLVGGLEAEQTQDGATFRNDRLLAVASASTQHELVREMDDLPPDFMEQIEQFFIGYNKLRGRVFKPLGRMRADQAMTIVKSSIPQQRRSD